MESSYENLDVFLKRAASFSFIIPHPKPKIYLFINANLYWFAFHREVELYPAIVECCWSFVVWLSEELLIRKCVCAPIMNIF